MRLHFLVEGPSEEAFLNNWLPRFLTGHDFRIYPHQGKGKMSNPVPSELAPTKRGLLDQLPFKLRAMGRSLKPDTDRIVVLVDLDNCDCKELKNWLLQLLQDCSPEPIVLFRIAIEELEAWFLGDQKALQKSFPKYKTAALKKYRQDSICGTWETLRDVIRAHPASDDKCRWAESISPHMSGPDGNLSPSFRVFCEGLRTICGEPTKRK